MSAAKRATDSVRAALTSLTPTHKLLIATVVVVLLMGLALVALLNSKPQLVEMFPGAQPADAQRAQAALTEAGIRVTNQGGRMLVSAGDAPRARVILAQAGAMPGDKVTYFETLISNTDWMNSRQVNERNYLIALQNELGRTISGFKGVSRASVQLSVPEPRGLGRDAARASASIAILSDTGLALAQGVVDAAARFVAGSIAGLPLEGVQVIDAAVGKPRVVTTDDSASSGAALEQAQRVEEQTRRKVEDLLAYIPGVIVGVTASVDVSRSVSETQEFLPEKKGTVHLEKSRTETSTVSTMPSNSGSPGFTANQSADIDRGPSGQAGSQNNDEKTDYDNHVGSRIEKVVDPKGQSTSVAISVNVPRGYVAKLLREAQPADAGGSGGAPPPAPTEKEIADRFDKDVKPQVLATLLPHVRAMLAASGPNADPKQVQEFISVALIPVDMPEVGAMQTAGLLGSGGGGGAGVLGLAGGLVDKVVVGVLALAAMGMMIAMVRKAGKKPATPSAEELVGLPPALETVGEVIGEADEGETAMAGIEVGEDEMQAQKVQEQVAELVDKDPVAASKLLGRWVQVED